MGGTDYDKEGIAGLGVATAAKVAMEYDGKTTQGASFAVQGAGAMGAAIIKYFSQYGGVLKAIADPRLGGTWFLKNGASAELLGALSDSDFIASKALLENGDYQHDDDLSQVLYAKVNVLFPAAVQDVIYIENADKIHADYISEGSNNPSSNEARSRLHENGITVIPDFIANPGGIIAAYIELTSTISAEENFKTRANVENAKTETINRISENVRTMMTLVRSLDIEPARAGRFMALQNLIR
jgi:glutamate dehydrogenase (NAD(P)+)